MLPQYMCNFVKIGVCFLPKSPCFILVCYPSFFTALQLKGVTWGRGAVFLFLLQKAYKALRDYKIIIIPAFIAGAMLGDSRDAGHFNSCKPCF